MELMYVLQSKHSEILVLQQQLIKLVCYNVMRFEFLVNKQTKGENNAHVPLTTAVIVDVVC